MAASVKEAFDGSDESNSSEDEDLEKFKEAVWDGGGTKKTDEGHNHPKPTRRLVVSDHQHDCNELQVTPEFRAHVAKKLEHMLDGFISEKPAGAVSHESSSTLEGDDLGFKLFATSIPGQRVDDTPCPVKRRPIPSSSESDNEMEMRIREAAVSVKDLLPPPLTAGEVMVDIKNPTEQSQEDETESPATQKKKKKGKMKATGKEESVAADFEEQKGQETTHKNVKHRVKTTSAKYVSDKSSLQSWEACGDLEENKQEGSSQAKVKRKRKRKRKAVDESTEV
ncbi:hypothetical protein N1851_033855 [Merluccius polli]|uniref:Protein CUSTOS n=1 Tax=Merluccius polli TaxID=89951 RepID=A0AA47NP51_MERPO|nr:hypothetical protein N1851_033855 [Merluccius polli]